MIQQLLIEKVTVESFQFNQRTKGWAQELRAVVKVIGIKKICSSLLTSIITTQTTSQSIST